MVVHTMLPTSCKLWFQRNLSSVKKMPGRSAKVAENFFKANIEYLLFKMLGIQRGIHTHTTSLSSRDSQPHTPHSAPPTQRPHRGNFSTGKVFTCHLFLHPLKKKKNNNYRAGAQGLWLGT